MDKFVKEAIEEAKRGLAEGGIPIGSILVIDGEIVGRGHNQRVQKDSVILHAEMDCLENAGRLRASDYRRSTMYCSLSPCAMCAGAIVLYKIPRVVIADNVTYQETEDYLRSHGVEVEVLNDPEPIQIMREFIAANPELWNEDIAE